MTTTTAFRISQQVRLTKDYHHFGVGTSGIIITNNAGIVMVSFQSSYQDRMVIR
jgi:hypothetical protein